MSLSVEQMVRDLLTQAIKDNLVDELHGSFDDPDPQQRSTGDLIGVANLLHGYIREAIQAERKACVAAIEQEIKSWTDDGTVNGLAVAISVIQARE